MDTTGAGDAFNAGFLSAWLGGQLLTSCLREGNVIGAKAIAGRGGFGTLPEATRRARAKVRLTS